MESGTFQAVCVGVVDIGTHTEEWQGKAITRDQLILLFDFPTEMIEINGEQKPRCLSLKLTKSQDEKSNMRKHFTSWRGRWFNEEELADFHMSKLLGVPATITVAQKTGNGKTYANISSVGKAMKGMEQKASRKIYFDLMDADTYSAVEDLPDWIVKEINSSAEAIATKTVFMKGKAAQQVAQMGNEGCDEGDDCPFE